jgi:hypothetical protein
MKLKSTKIKPTTKPKTDANTVLADVKFTYCENWWEPGDETFEEMIKPFKDWEIFKMFLVYAGEEESYRVIFRR